MGVQTTGFLEKRVFQFHLVLCLLWLSSFYEVGIMPAATPGSSGAGFANLPANEQELDEQESEEQKQEEIRPEQASEYIGRGPVRIRMRIRHAKDRLEKRGVLYLDSAEDFTDEKNLGVAINVEAAQQLARQGITPLEETLVGQEVIVCGCVMRFEERLYVPVLDVKQIQFVRE